MIQRLSTRTLLILATLLLSLLPTVFLVSIGARIAKDDLEAEARRRLKESVESARAVAAEFRKLSEDGLIPKHIAQESARQLIMKMGIGEYGHVWAMDSRGILIIDSRNEGQPIAHYRWAQEMIAQKNGMATYTWHETKDAPGETKEVAFRYLGDWDWIIASASPLAEFSAPARRVGYVAAIGGVVAMVVAVLLGLSITLTITRPLEDLMRVAEEVSQGQLATLFTPQGPVEFRLLGKGFLEMRQELARTLDQVYEGSLRLAASLAETRKANLALQESERLLEAKVIERTKELAAARDQALEATRAKSAFLANMSHELRTPLNAILGYSEMLQEEAEELGQEDLVPDLKKVHAAGKHLLALINDVLDLSKIEAGKMELFLEEFEIAEMINEVIATVEPMVQQNQNRLVINCAPEVGAMRADLLKVRQSLFNLLSNASKFTEGGTITLDVTRTTQQAQRSWITFQITDTGIGMTSDQVQKLFQAFTQADHSTTRKYGGTGLGLAITRHFCEMMGGEISVESEVGMGTTFTVRLPAVAAAASGENTAQPAAEGALAGEQNLVLVIDDDPAVRDLMQRFLAREGFRTIATADGIEGLRLARELRPCVITLDVIMPEMDGWAVLSALKSDPSLSEIPVIMLTIADNKNLGYALGATEYMTKPFDRERLSTVLRRYCLHKDPDHPVLIVDDDPAAREMLRYMLEKEGFRTAEAEHGVAALHLLETVQTQAILLDLMMPEMDGFTFTTEVRKRAEWRSIPIVVVTARELSTEERAQLNGSVRRVLQKGAFSREELLQEVRVMLTSLIHSPEHGSGLPEDKGES